MGLEVALMAASLAVTVNADQEARSARHHSQKAQRKIQAEQRASNSAEALLERRQQIREERVRRARILQSSENTGTSGSSGEAGAISSLATQFGANLGFNVGKLQTARNISIFSQDAANAQADLFSAQSDAALGQSLFSMGSSIAGAGGFDFSNPFKTSSGFEPGFASTVGMST